MIKTIDAFILRCDKCSKTYQDVWLSDKQAKKEAENDGWRISKGIDLCDACNEKREEAI